MSQQTRTYLAIDAEGVITEQPEASDRLAQLQALVGGWIEFANIGGPATLRACVNEGGLLLGLPANRRMAGLAGTVVMGALGPDPDKEGMDFLGLNPGQLALVRRMTKTLPLAPREEADDLLPKPEIRVYRLNPDGSRGEEII